MSAVPEIWRRNGASISGPDRRIKSANFADLVSGLKRLRSAPKGRVPTYCGRMCKQAAIRAVITTPNWTSAVFQMT
jgi:hypothetical protein